MSKTNLDDEALVEKYLSGSSLTELREELGVSIPCLKGHLRKMGVTFRTASESQTLRNTKYQHPFVGRTHTEATKAKMKAHHANVSGEKNPNFGKGCFGETNGHWKGGVREEGKQGRHTRQHKDWIVRVLERDGHECQLCQSTEDLVVHHVKNWRLFPELRFVDSNGITLCRRHHNTNAQWEDDYEIIFSEMVRLKGLSWLEKYSSVSLVGLRVPSSGATV